MVAIPLRRSTMGTRTFAVAGRSLGPSWRLVAWLWLLLAALSCVPVRGADAAGAPIATCFALDVSGSNWAPDAGYPASDPGPEYVRAALVRLYGALLGTDTGGRVGLVGYAAFGTTVTDAMPLVDVTDDGGRAALDARLVAALTPSGWTSTLSGVRACVSILERAP